MLEKFIKYLGCKNKRSTIATVPELVYKVVYLGDTIHREKSIGATGKAVRILDSRVLFPYEDIYEEVKVTDTDGYVLYPQQRIYLIMSLNSDHPIPTSIELIHNLNLHGYGLRCGDIRASNIDGVAALQIWIMNSNKQHAVHLFPFTKIGELDLSL